VKLIVNSYGSDLSSLTNFRLKMSENKEANDGDTENTTREGIFTIIFIIQFNFLFI